MNLTRFLAITLFCVITGNALASHDNDSRHHKHPYGMNTTGINLTRWDDHKHRISNEDNSSMVQSDEEIEDNHDVKRVWFVVANRPGYPSGIIPNFFENSSFVGFNFTSPLSNLPTFEEVKNKTSSLISNLGRYLPSFQRQRRSSNYAFPLLPTLAAMDASLNHSSNQTNETMTAFSKYVFPLLPSIANISAMPYALNAISNQNNMTMANTTAPFPLPLRNMTKRAVSGDIYFPLFNMVMMANMNDSSPSANKTTSANEKFPLTYAKFKNNTMDLLHSILPSIYRRSPNQD